MPGGDTILPSSRSKVRLKKGFGLRDWVRLLASAKDLAHRQGKPIRRNISAKEISTHCTEYDAWISLHGKVYNITPYLHYHPGGIDILRPCFGRDASVLFDKYHRWVNTEGLIGALLLGYLEIPQKRDNNIDMLPPSSKKIISPALLPPPDAENDEDDKNPWE